MKIIIIGAGPGGLSAAYALAQGGHDVTVYEKKSREKLSYDWHDDVARSVFKDLDIPLPGKEEYFVKRNWAFNVPDAKWLKLNIDSAELDYSIERRALADILIKRAETAGAKIIFEKAIDRLIVLNKAVKGVTLEGKDISAELVVDSSGVFSGFRESVAELFGLAKRPHGDEIFYTYRAFHEADKDALKDVEITNKAYIRWLDDVGVAWCVLDPPTGTFNILAGHVGGLTDKDLERCLGFLREDNPALLDTVLRGGSVNPIPIRYPATRMVGDGFALIGDAAFMTIPILGSGIENSLRAGVILADVVNKSGKATAVALWEYQTRYMKEVGAGHISVDYLKRWLLSAPRADLAYLFDGGIMTDNELKEVSAGRRLVLSFKDILYKIKKGYKRLPLLLRLNGVLARANKGYKIGTRIPRKYNIKAIALWETRLKGVFLRLKPNVEG